MSEHPNPSDPEHAQYSDYEKTYWSSLAEPSADEYDDNGGSDAIRAADEPDPGESIPLPEESFTDAKAVDHLVAELDNAGKDSVTGLLTKKAFTIILQKKYGVQLDKWEKSPGSERRRSTKSNRVVLIYADVNYLREVNNNLGHPAGDALLSRVAAKLSANTRPTDLVARVGGDEFMIVIDVPSDLPDDKVEEFSQKRLDSFTALFAPPQHSETFTYSQSADEIPDQVSFGAAVGELRYLTEQEREDYGKNPPATTFDALEADADKAMFEHKDFLKSNHPDAD